MKNLNLILVALLSASSVLPTQQDEDCPLLWPADAIKDSDDDLRYALKAYCISQACRSGFNGNVEDILEKIKKEERVGSEETYNKVREFNKVHRIRRAEFIKDFDPVAAAVEAAELGQNAIVRGKN